MPPRKPAQAQARQRSLLEYNTQRSSRSKMRRSKANAIGKLSKQNQTEVGVEVGDPSNGDTKTKRNSVSVEQTGNSRSKGKRKEENKGKSQHFNSERLDSSESEFVSTKDQKAKPSSVISIKSSSEDESHPTTKAPRGTRKKAKIAESDTDIDVLESTANDHAEDEDSQTHSLKRHKFSGRTRQRSLLEYATPGRSKDQKKIVNEKSQVYQSDSESDSPRKFRFEPSMQSVSNTLTSPPQTGSDLEDEEDDDGVAPRIRSRTLPKRQIQKNNSTATFSGEDNSPVFKKRRNVAFSDDEEDEDCPSSSKRRKLIRGNRPRFGELSSEDEQLIEEAEEEEAILSSRFRNRSKKNDFVRNLERLKRKKRGEKVGSPKEDDSQESYTSGSEAEPAPPEDNIFADAMPAHLYNSDEDTLDQDDNFIVDDDEAAVELPAMFNMGTFQDLSHHFKIICQLFVHLSIKKRSQRTEFMKQALESTYFSVPLSMSRRKLLSLRDSLVASSIWKPEFRKPLEIYPEFKLQPLNFAVPHCDACNLSSRISTLQGSLRGERYDSATYQNKGKEISLDWNLGRFCAARAQVFHKLTHWEYSLFHALDMEINQLRKIIKGRVVGSRKDIFMPATKGPPPPDDLDDADGWMEWLDGRGLIEAEWHEMKAVMDRAHNLEAKGKGDDDDAVYS